MEQVKAMLWLDPTHRCAEAAATHIVSSATYPFLPLYRTCSTRQVTCDSTLAVGGASLPPPSLLPPPSSNGRCGRSCCAIVCALRSSVHPSASVRSRTTAALFGCLMARAKQLTGEPSNARSLARKTRKRTKRVKKPANETYRNESF